jgi:hypothetical protein
MRLAPRSHLNNYLNVIPLVLFSSCWRSAAA